MISVLNTENGEADKAAVWKPIPTCSKAVLCLDTYCHFLSGVPNMPESIIRKIWGMENYT
jgi:hypothetical protein